MFISGGWNCFHVFHLLRGWAGVNNESLKMWTPDTKGILRAINLRKSE